MSAHLEQYTFHVMGIIDAVGKLEGADQLPIRRRVSPSHGTVRLLYLTTSGTGETRWQPPSCIGC